MHRHKFSRAFCGYPRPNRFERRSVGKHLLELRDRIRGCGWPLSDQFGDFQPNDDLPPNDSPLSQSLIGMGAEDIAILSYRLANIFS